jgi:polysaccharide pyruvyl transferase WcaK-like protein
MATLSWIDPSCKHIGNAGDEIIADSVWRELKRAAAKSSVDLDLSMVNRISSHHVITRNDARHLKASRFVIVGGTNLLQSDVRKWRQWKVRYTDVHLLRGLSLCGVGWWQYGQSRSLHTVILQNAILRSRALHSVRDNFTKSMLARNGIRNVINTCCPTLWECTEEAQDSIPSQIAEDCITCLTDYNRNEKEDHELLTLLSKLYRTVYFWPQCPRDEAYAKSLCSGLTNVRFLEEGVLRYNDFLLSERNIEFVGTRLHGGIRAIQMGKRVTIIGIDNRAIEIGRDTSLNVIPRGNVELLKSRLTSKFKTRVFLPWAEIERYRSYLTERIAEAFR